MTTTLLTALLAGALAGDLEGLSLENALAVELRYSGTLAPLTRDGAGAAVKEFSVYALITPREPQSLELAYVVEETGGGGWAWPERYGTVALDENRRPAEDARPIRVLYNHLGTHYPLELSPPVFANADKLQADAAWTADRQSYEVTGTRTVAESECWQVAVMGPVGHREQLSVARTVPIVVAAEKRVFVGQGEPFVLQMTLDSARRLDAAQAERLKT
ncbi:MAG: hypothetical protein ACREIV_10065, partial [Planctomycetaceae bacterium]